MLKYYYKVYHMMKQQRKQEKKQNKQNNQSILKDGKHVVKEQLQRVGKVGKVGGGSEQLPTIQNMLQIKAEDRPSKTAEYFKKVRQFLHTYMQKKQGSRVIQLMYKWGNEQIKSSIYKSILQNWKQLIKSKYALHAISKVSNQYEFPKIVEDAVLLQNNKQGSMVLENFIHKHPGSPKVIQLTQKFENIHKQAEQKGFQSQQVLHNLAMKSVQKQYYSNRLSKLIIKLALPTLVKEERQKMVQSLAEHSLSLLNDQEGVKLFVNLYNYFDSKQKKNLITKQVKGKIHQILAMSKNSYVALVKIITQTDDTVMIGNKIMPEILQSVSDISNNNSKIYHILISLLSPRNNNFNCLGKIQKVVLATNCKKPEQKRKQQIREFIYLSLVQYLTADDNIQKTCKGPNQSRLALGLIKSMQEDGSDQLKSLSTKIVKYFIDNLNSLKIGHTKKFSIEQSLVADTFGSKLIKNILLLQESFIDKYYQQLNQIFKNNLDKVINSNASFVLTVMIQKGMTDLLDQIKRSKIDLSKAKASDFYLSRIKGNAQ